MADIVGLLLPFFGLILIGAIAARITKQPAEALGWLNTFIVYAALPALFFKLVSQTPIEQLTRLGFIGTDLAATYSIFVLLLIVGRFVRRNSLPESTMQAFAGAYGNIGYMGPALALLAFGEKAAVPVALIVCLENALHFIVAPALMAIEGKDKRTKARLACDVARKVLFHPFILSTALGFVAAATAVDQPLAFRRFVDYLAQAAAPCALFAMGVTLALRPLRRIPAEIGYIVPAKLILHPLVVYLALEAVGGIEPIWIYSAVLLAALPTATNVFVMSQQYGVWQERASATILISTAASIVTVSAILYMIRSGSLPAQLFH
ncbi:MULTISPECIES: AEC family transporter [Rhizobium]|uniref:AEC family transporter n=1 Tax=Rhizobium rhododendri TaxID=2506430 RepID=A0ABY8IK70_9HYPH|nr:MULTISPECIES: AEC family transporter [Rhizobium]MBZ5757977.1 AEC family transporter [Rhizobium sp. VS19-DR96]MBZ5765193.1 AEC family transporter [Rhizobium sp. VS19-DR129.2]MBZ5772736.1 AEC family transporter [Rhizobium sp. VS19-DRK62.2]MBZ5782577.1 AEC family transporter [Rhizobium sp. VS19-DR121]MBZ5800025.1 AEC family transporter [Rhizobium sp. VS19-DR181]